MASLDVDGAMQNVKSVLAGSTAWQTICKVDNSADAALRIYEGGIEDTSEEDSLAPCITLKFDPFQTDWKSTSMGQLVIDIGCEVPIPEENQLTFADRYRYAWQKMSAIMAAINDTPGSLMIRALAVKIEPGEINPVENNNRIEWGWVIGLTLDFI